MTNEETAFVVDQHLIEFRLDRRADTQTLGDLLKDRGQCLWPMPAADPHPLGLDLPAVAHIRIDDGIGATPIGRLLRDGDQLLRLNRQQRQRDRTNPLHRQGRWQQRDCAACIKIPRTASFTKQAGQFGHDIGH
jgi:hypothetical protein